MYTSFLICEYIAVFLKFYKYTNIQNNIFSFTLLSIFQKFMLIFYFI